MDQTEARTTCPRFRPGSTVPTPAWTYLPTLQTVHLLNACHQIEPKCNAQGRRPQGYTMGLRYDRGLICQSGSLACPHNKVKSPPTKIFPSGSKAIVLTMPLALGANQQRYAKYTTVPATLRRLLSECLFIWQIQSGNQFRSICVMANSSPAHVPIRIQVCNKQGAEA